MKTEHIDNLIDHANNNGCIDLDHLRKDILFSPPNGPAPIIPDVNEATRVGPTIDRKENWHGDNWWDWLLIRVVNFFSW